ncbi:hypothetical protein D3C78_1416390 [compost metagenome]
MLAGLPTTRTLTLRLATSFRALPCAVKIWALTDSRSLRSMPGPRGRAPTSRATSASLKAVRGSLWAVTSCSSGKAQSSNSMMTPFRAFCAFSSGISSSCRMTG